MLTIEQHKRGSLRIAELEHGDLFSFPGGNNIFQKGKYDGGNGSFICYDLTESYVVKPLADRLVYKKKGTLRVIQPAVPFEHTLRSIGSLTINQATQKNRAFDIPRGDLFYLNNEIYIKDPQQGYAWNLEKAELDCLHNVQVAILHGTLTIED